MAPMHFQSPDSNGAKQGRQGRTEHPLSSLDSTQASHASYINILKRYASKINIIIDTARLRSDALMIILFWTKL